MIRTLYILFALVWFTRSDGHRVWINKDQILAVQGAGQLGMHPGTLIQYGGTSVIVQQNVSQVVRTLREAQ